MDQRLQAWLAAHQGVITTVDAARLGLSGQELRALVGRELLRVTRGAYVSAAADQSASPAGRHRLRVLAVLRARPLLAASHVSAAVVWELPLWTRSLTRVHVARRRRGPTRRHQHYTVHGCYDADAMTVHHGAPVVHAALAVLGTAIIQGFEAGVMAADAALHRELTTREQLEHWLARHRQVPGVTTARQAVHRANALSESPGESRCRLVLESLGYTVVPQHVVRDADGTFIGRVDFLIRALGLVVEFDGVLKYEHAAREGRAALVAEKHREDAIRALHYGVARITWDDLDHPARIELKVRQAARVSRRGR